MKKIYCFFAPIFGKTGKAVVFRVNRKLLQLFHALLGGFHSLADRNLPNHFYLFIIKTLLHYSIIPNDYIIW